jgi:hypothetical protein
MLLVVQKNIKFAQAGWPIPIILATPEVEIRKIVVPDECGQKKGRPYLKNIQHTTKGLLEWLKWKSTCLANLRPRVQTPVLPTKLK